MLQNTALWIHYEPMKHDAWTGRPDGPRLHHIAKCLDLSKPTPIPACDGFALIGFACDEGVKRNLGRTGAALGPNKIRQFLANMPVREELDFFDLGNILCNDSDLESAQVGLSEAIANVHKQGLRSIVLGGGHEVAFGHFLGLASSKKYKNIGIINFDSHLDMRPLLEGNKGSSGTPFLQIANDCKREQLNFNYMCIGAQPFANTSSIFESARILGAQIITANTLRNNPESVTEQIDQFILQLDALYLTVCMDVFAQSAAPGVSAPQPLGLLPHEVLPTLQRILASQKVKGFDVAELCPPLDRDDMTARLAAQLIGMVINLDE